MSLYIFVIGAALLSVVYALVVVWKIQKSAKPTEKIAEISSAIREGAMAFLKREYRTIGLVAAVIFVLLWLVLGAKVALGFLTGAVLSALAGYIGMVVSTKTNAKVAEASKQSLKKSFGLAFQGGSVTGFFVVGLGLLGVSIFWLLTKDLKALAGLGFGASLISIFARLAGGIYTKAADVGADLVGKVEQGIPEDDPRNPAVIADQVGDNVGDCAGMAADLFETYVVTIAATMILGSLLFAGSSVALVLPLLLSGAGIVSSIAATLFVKLGKKQGIMAALYKGVAAAAVISALLFIPIISKYSQTIGLDFANLYVPSLIGLALAFGLFLITDYYTSKKHKPVQQIAEASQSGHATNVIAGLAIGMQSTYAPVVLISISILVSYWLGGIYGLAVAAVSLLSLTGMIIAMDSYGPITDNAAGILEMAGADAKSREAADALDSVGNTTKAVTKSVAIGSAALAALVLFAAYTQEIINAGQNMLFSLSNPKILVGLLLGGLLPYVVASSALRAVGRAGGKVVEEVRRQFKEIKGIMEGAAKPEYGKCVDIVTKAAIKEMILPTMVIVVLPILVGFLLGAEALGGLLIGCIVTGFFVGISMATGGGAWDNAKKYIEDGHLGGKKSPAHQAAVTGDTVGDPYKDTAGPAINPMIKVVNIIALLIISLII
ncbi:sodium-translocating pyrophosphatase [bacterium (Candidatus Gribaldobacteria) CG_4_10_14_0_2_um_filter_41_16]|uniref:K(+)-insensitive pyrophosphate-energized proton pump n=4 Tax=Candidatus Gribaldobacteria TaxID=2798536 RepID=A0A2M7VJT2_9BACT|nr:MAG: sodium-translocating pyrophosphatase [Parcubacteria group bacterium CG1_02_41_26]PIR91615.1 MAG: sodium-translocating pyrophosphatase [bacterium (Candidatus Gribaldobacteria) CG10_big_fil_rev_8_21_14_0_10_41_12]PIV47164.1 MAG: sodium-translocating pyrophosphatase [bacterium (Candidatus Gribaldobacteria) CG02_land_8_20_14_3_00_41_15]PJA01919.1 MAG: sodium-translocating pyrophosphatase [bacterium (Candidatus Gribaldobacteria) CG_4_10_14_0_2_um_filter_41_16]